MPRKWVDWNHLPTSIANIPDIVLFKNDIANVCTL